MFFKITTVAFFLLLISAIQIQVDENELPETHTTNLKEQHDYPIIKFQGNAIFYLDGDVIKTLNIQTRGQDYDLFFMESNKTYLHYERYGGFADFYQWTVYIKRE